MPNSCRFTSFALMWFVLAACSDGAEPDVAEAVAAIDKVAEAFTAEDIRFTRKGDALYAIALDWPDSGKLTIKTLKAGAELYPVRISQIQLFGSEGELKWRRTDEELTVTLPSERPCEHAFAFKIEAAS